MVPGPTTPVRCKISISRNNAITAAQIAITAPRDRRGDASVPVSALALSLVRG